MYIVYVCRIVFLVYPRFTDQNEDNIIMLSVSHHASCRYEINIMSVNRWLLGVAYYIHI